MVRCMSLGKVLVRYKRAAKLAALQSMLTYAHLRYQIYLVLLFQLNIRW